MFTPATQLKSADEKWKQQLIVSSYVKCNSTNQLWTETMSITFFTATSTADLRQITCEQVFLSVLPGELRYYSLRMVKYLFYC